MSYIVAEADDVSPATRSMVCLGAILVSGTYDECVEFKLEKSLLAKRNGNDVEPEGHVIKPAIPRRDAQGSRIIFKNVYEAFAERHSSNKNFKATMKKRQVRPDFEHADAVLNLLTTVRVDKRAAELGVEDKFRFKDLLFAVSDDVIKDLKETESLEVTREQINHLVVPAIQQFFN